MIKIGKSEVGYMDVKSNVTVVILTKNEEAMIEEVIENAKRCTPHIIVVDSESTDNTVELAKKSGANVLVKAWEDDFALQRNYALPFVHTEWVLYLDADERMNDELIDDIKRVTADGSKHASYEFRRKANAFGQRVNHGSMRPDTVQRLFPTSRVQWVNKVHERPVTELPIKRLKGYVDHYTYTNWDQYWKKFNQYTTIWAESAYARGKRVSIVSAHIHAAFAWLKIAIFDRGLLDGWLGVTLSANHYLYTLMKYMKLIELNRKK